MQFVSFFPEKYASLRTSLLREEVPLDYTRVGGRREEGTVDKGFCLGDFLYVP